MLDIFRALTQEHTFWNVKNQLFLSTTSLAKSYLKEVTLTNRYLRGHGPDPEFSEVEYIRGMVKPSEIRICPLQ